uniref:non-specific serine/threonine protein kinase n=1 Tax=Fagus sylvatica TaxID=28930 RepID=A0A2N9FBF8_FAGSY
MRLRTCSKSATVPIFANETDHVALLDFKNGITQDPLQIMSSWNDSVHFCNWIGVTCSPSNKTVMVLNLAAKRLAGSISPSIEATASLGNQEFTATPATPLGITLVTTSSLVKFLKSLDVCNACNISIWLGITLVVARLALFKVNIAIDVANALEYLHHHCQNPIVHCDLKPSNVLLDKDMVAHVGDFGLAKFLFEASNNPSKTQTLSIGLKGSIGYIPPKYGMSGQVSTLGDIYSYGILLLEMFIGKRPIDEMFKDGLSIHKFTAMALPEHVMDIVDLFIFFEEDKEDDDDDERNEDDIEDRAIIEEDDPHVNVSRGVKDCLMSVFQIGLSCSTTSLDERMPANVIVNEMNLIRDTFLKFKEETEEE